jgi:hypothetical protein
MTLNAWSITQDSTVTVYPSDQAIPVSPSLTLNVGMDASNTIITPVDADGTVTVHLSAGTIQASMDVSGYYTPTDGTGGYYPVTPSRLGTLTMTGSGDTESVQVTGRAGVPDAATSVALSVSVKDPTAETPFSVWGSDFARPEGAGARLSVDVSQNATGLVIAKIGASGKVNVWQRTGSSTVLVDVLGYNMPGQTDGTYFTPIAPEVLLDTTQGVGGPQQPLAANTPVEFYPGFGQTSVGATASSVLVDITAVNPTVDGKLTVYSSDLSGPPNVASAQYNAGTPVTTETIVATGLDGGAMINAGSATDVVVTVVGYYAPSSSYTAQAQQPDDPAGAQPVAPGQTVTVRSTEADGTRATANIHMDAVPSSGTANATAGTGGCWGWNGWVNYGWGSVRAMAYNDNVRWCGNGTVVTSKSDQIYGTVTTAGQSQGWGYDGVISNGGNPQYSQYYGGFAYQEFSQGKFSQCFFKFGCTGFHKYPRIWWNIYADNRRPDFMYAP